MQKKSKKISSDEGYTIVIYYSSEDLCYVADILELDGHCMAHGNTYEEALREIKVAIKGWLKTAKGSNIKIPEPLSNKNFSGKLVLRIPPSKHRQLVIEAQKEGVSLNRLISQRL